MSGRRYTKFLRILKPKTNLTYCNSCPYKQKYENLLKTNKAVALSFGLGFWAIVCYSV